MNDEFYIGWEDKAPATIGSRVRWAVVLLLMTTFLLGAGLALTQRTIGVSVFEWGKVKEFTGVLNAKPYPHLLVPRPGTVPCTVQQSECRHDRTIGSPVATIRCRQQ